MTVTTTGAGLRPAAVLAAAWGRLADALPVPVCAFGRRGYLSDTLELGAYPEAVPAARRRSRLLLAEWGLAELADDAEQVISEVVTNAVEAHRAERLDAPVRLSLFAGLRTLLIVVRDASSRPPVPDNPDFDGEHGRGLLIVTALAAHWDSKPCPGGGKVVRVLLRGRRHPSANTTKTVE